MSPDNARDAGLGCYRGLVHWLPVVLLFWALVAVAVWWVAQ